MYELGFLLISLSNGVHFSLDAPLGTSNIGYIIVAIILSPALILVLASMLGHPRRYKITVLFLGILITMFTVFIAATYLLGLVTGFFF